MRERPASARVRGRDRRVAYDEFINDPRWFGVRFISLLDKAPAESLMLDADMGDFYADDIDGLPIEDAYLTIRSLPTSRTNMSTLSMTPILDMRHEAGSQMPFLRRTQAGRGAARRHAHHQPCRGHRQGIHGEKRDLILDNNITASPRYKEVMEEIRSLGFERDAVLVRDGRKLKRRVDFNQGVDARILCKDPMYLREMSKICISPLRIAFDHLGLRKPYVQAVRYANEFGIDQLSNYMLNFHDSSAVDLYERLRINIDLNEELGIRIWSFPMRYQVIKDRVMSARSGSGTGCNHSRSYCRPRMVSLAETRNISAWRFGETRQDFETILSMPHHMIFHRDYFDHYEGKADKSFSH